MMFHGHSEFTQSHKSLTKILYIDYTLPSVFVSCPLPFEIPVGNNLLRERLYLAHVLGVLFLDQKVPSHGLLMRTFSGKG